MPKTNAGVGQMLNSFDVNIQANNNALANKYVIYANEYAQVTQANRVWAWFEAAMKAGHDWNVSLTRTRDLLSGKLTNVNDPLPPGPAMPPVPTVGTPPQPAVIEHGFFTFFSSLAARIKANPHYDPADGMLLGIEGTPVPAPKADVVPLPTVELFTSGHPEVSCVKGQFQGFDVHLTRPGQPRRLLGFSTGRRYNVAEPLPAPGVAEVWSFEVQYHLQNAAFGQMSAPVTVTVRG